jgi:hypothetical protein
MIPLLLTNTVAHPLLDSVRNLHLGFPSPSSTLLVQTMDVGILKKIEDFVQQKFGKLKL